MAVGFRFKGSIGVLVDAFFLEARFTLSREGELEYDEGALVRILNDAGVTTGFEPGALSSAVAAFQKSKETEQEVVVAKGTPPTPPVPETWEWAEHIMSTEDAAAAAQAFKAAGPPQVFQVRVEKVKVQKKIAAKGGLFGSGQEEIQTVIENREVREKVLVDPNPVKTGTVEFGTLVATVYAAKPGAPGTDLAGKPIPAPVGRVSAVFLGAGLSREKGEVRASVAGFLRVGRNWADVVSPAGHRWSVTYSPDKKAATLSFSPAGAAEAPQAAAVLEKLAADGFTAPVPPEAELQRWLDEAVRSGRTLVRPLVSDRDGGFDIRFSADHSKAFLDLHKPQGTGQPVSLKDLGTALRDAQLKGFSFDTVKGAIEDFLKGPEAELKDLPLASGTPPTRGKDLVLQYQAGFVSDEDLAAITANLTATPRYLEGVPDRQQFPPSSVQKAAPVRADQQFASLEPPEGDSANEGMDVHGNKIPSVPGNEPPLLLLSNVRKNGNKLESTIDGLMETAVLDGVTVFRVRPHLDAMAVVTRSPDNLQAWMTLVQGRGTGRRLDRAVIDAALESAQIRKGVIEAKIVEALEAVQAGNKVELWLVAEGIPAGNDLDRRLVFAQPAKTDAQGRRRAPVRAGEVAATYHPPQADQIDGTDVLGNLIPSNDMEVRSLVVSEDFEVAVNEHGHQVITALKSGDLVFDGNGVSLVTSVAVGTVGGKAGNVKFAGEVVVTGGIENGAYVMAGNLKVKGRVGAALLSSDHNIQVADGIHGEGKAVLRAKKHISVGFVEKALVMAVGDVHVGKTALGCTFRVNGKIFQKTTGGGLQGGLVKVRLGLDVMNLGSPTGVNMTVSYGQDYLIEDQIQAEVKETDKLREAIVQIDAVMRKLTSPADKDKLNSARQKKVLMMKMLDKRNLKIINLRDKFDLHVPSEIVIRETLFPGVMIESHGRLYEAKTRKNALRLVFNEQTGHIEEFPLT